jgi:60 kDa SS-A/Ro ribonucleoprotein
MIKDGKGPLLVDIIEKVYDTGRAPKLDMTMMALAIASSCNDLNTRKKAYNGVSKLRTLSHIYTWKGYHKLASKSKGMGRLSKESLCKVFENMSAKQLCYQITKYPHRKTSVEDWSFIDLIRCIHLKADKMSTDKQFIMKYAIRGNDEASEFLKVHNDLEENYNVKYLQAITKIKSLSDTDEDRLELIKNVYTFNLPREVIPTWGFKYTDVWRSLLLDREQTKVLMPFTALIRNLAVMTVHNVFDDVLTTSIVADHITNELVLKKARIHPVNILLAFMTYRSGHGEKGRSIL